MTSASASTFFGKISFYPSQLLTTVQYGFTIDSTILTDFSRGNSTYSYSVDLSDGNRVKTPGRKSLRALKIKLWKLELKPVRKSVQLQRKLLVKLKVQQDEWERNPVSEWKIPSGDIKVEFPIFESLPSIQRDEPIIPKSPTRSSHNPMSPKSSNSPMSPKSPTSPSPPTTPNNTSDSAYSSPATSPKQLRPLNSISNPKIRPLLLHSKRINTLNRDVDMVAEEQTNFPQLEVTNQLESSQITDGAEFGRKLDRVDVSAQTLIVAIQKRTSTVAKKKHRLSTTNIAKNLFTEQSSGAAKTLFPETNENGSNTSTTSFPDLAQRRRSSIAQQYSQSKPLLISTARPKPRQEVRRRTLNLKIISADESYSDLDDGTPSTPGSILSPEDTQSVVSPVSTRSHFSVGVESSRNSDTIPKWAQRALSPASTPSTMKKQRFIDRNDPTSYAYIMYFIQGAHEECFTSFKKFCQCILYVGAGSQECSPFTSHFSTLLEGSQYSLTERLFRMEQHNSRVPVHKPHDRFRVFLLQLPTSDYTNEEWIMAHLRQASMLAALTSSLEGLWKKPLKHLNTFRACPTNDNTSIIMNETIGVEFNKVLRFERIQFGLNLLKITFIRAQNEAIELDLSDVKLIEKEKRRSGNNLQNLMNGNSTPISEPVRIVDTKRYRLYFSKSDEEWLQLFPDDLRS